MDDQRMIKQTGNAERMIQDVAGCGLFQAGLLMIVSVMVKPTIAFSILFMAFGSYSPGWRCLDNTTTVSTAINSTTTGALNITTGNDFTIDGSYVTGLCDDYEKCSEVEFNPETSTMVTEWKLVCDKAWILKLIISMQMLGMLVGSYVCGHLSDLIGRKKVLCLGIAGSSLSHLISSFSTSWVMFLIFRFFIGMFGVSSLIVVLIFISEFCTRKWRATVVTFPVWYIGATLMALTSWVLKDWRDVDRVGCVLSAICLIPMLWVPESLRWLEVKKKDKEFKSVSRKILRCNRKHFSGLDSINLNPSSDPSEKQDGESYNVLDLLRKDYRMITFCIVFLQFAFSLLYYAMTFGTKSLYGNFYLNLFVFNSIPIPFGVLSMMVMNTVSRRMHTLSFLVLAVILSIASIVILLSGDDRAKDFGSTILISMSKGTLDGAWLGLYARNAEVYPTVVRGIGLGVGGVSARLGGILAPFLIPNDKSVLYIFMIIMAVVNLVCSFVSYKLPETKGKLMKQKFDDSSEDQIGI